MYGKKSRKFFLASLLALTAILGTFSAAWAAASLTFSTPQNDNTAGINNGAIAVDTQDSTKASTQAYFLKGAATGNVTVTVLVDGAGYANAAGNVSFSAGGSSTWTVTGSEALTTNAFTGAVVTLAKAISAFPATLTDDVVTITGTEGTDAPTCQLTITPVAIEPKLSEALVTIFTGDTAADKQTITIANSAALTPAVGFTLTGHTLTAPGNMDIVTNSPLWTGLAVAKEGANGFAFTPDGSQTTHAALEITAEVAANGIGLTGDTVTGAASTMVAGVAAGTVMGKFGIEVREPFVSPDVTTKTFTVGTNVTAASGHDFDVETLPDGTQALTGIATVATGGTLAGSQEFGGGMTVTLGVDRKVTFRGTPTSADSRVFWIAAGALKRAELRVNVTGAAAGSYAMSLTDTSAVGLVVGQDVPAGTSRNLVVRQGATTVTPTISALAVSPDHGAVVAGTAGAVTWNGLTITPIAPTAGTAGQVTITGRPTVLDVTGKTFKIRATSPVGEIAPADLTIQVTQTQPTTGPISVTPPSLYYVGQQVAESLTVTNAGSLTIKKVNETAAAGSERTFNGLTFSVISPTQISVSGSANAPGSQGFILTGGSGTTTSFMATISATLGTDLIDTESYWITDDNDQLVQGMIVGQLNTILFPSRADLVNAANPIRVFIQAPGDSLAEELSRINPKTGNGFSVGTNHVSVYYRPTRNGDYKISFSINDNSLQSLSVPAGGASGSSGGGGCAAGFGAMALLALGGLAFLRRRGK